MIPIKQPNERWNDEQWQAIYAKKDEILISAGAGSGKTAVLVERIIQKILRDGIDVDQLLVLTFTEAAAAEMKERIRFGIEEQLQKSPENRHLNNQLNKLPRAQISTFHSFCSQLLRRYYYLLDIDPAFSISDDVEIGILQEEILESLFDELSQDEDFQYLSESFNSDRDDEALKTMILKIYDLARSNPDMESWLQNLPDLYCWEGEDLSCWPLYSQLLELIAPELEAAGQDLEEAVRFAGLAEVGDAAHKYPLDVYPLDKNYLAGAQNTSVPYETLRRHFYQAKFAAFPSYKKSYDRQMHDQSKAFRDRFKKNMEKVKEGFLGYSNSTHERHFKQAQKAAKTLSRLIFNFHDRFAAAKRGRQILDFSDLEWFTLNLLLDKEGQPSPTAIEAGSRISEIMIDEYQDTNSMQETIVTAVAKAQAAPIPLFMVGDVKQSIYRFRLAEPAIFRKKYLAYSGDVESSSPTLRIDLMKNYRSHRQVIESTNFIFEQLMDIPVGEIEYDEAAKLRLGAATEPDTSFHNTEIHLLDKEELANDSEDELSAAQLEAHHIARTIFNWKASGQRVYDRKTGTSKEVTYKDVVILMRSLSHVTAFQDVFRHYGIPLFTEQTTDLFESIEVINIISCLKVIDNPYQDIPLAGLLRSPLFFFDERELALIKSFSQKQHFYERLREYGSKGEDGNLRKKVLESVKRIQNWRLNATQMPVSGLISGIYEQTLYVEFVQGLSHGTFRKANLDVFLDRARQYEQHTKKGVYGFLRHIEKMQDLGKHFGKAKTVTAMEDVVRIMSIHKSKGLEFPIVFVSQIQKEFNKMDELGNYIRHKDYGVALKYIDPIQRLRQKTIAQQLVSKILHHEMLAEEMRLLYVAMTRAKSKLVFTGVINGKNKIEKSLPPASEPGILLSRAYRMQSKSFSDWLLPAALKSRSLVETIQNFGHEAPPPSQNDSRWELKLFKQMEPLVKVEAEAEKTAEKPPHLDLASAFSKPYGFSELVTISAKQSVSQRKIEETVPLFTGIYESRPQTAYDRPSFMKEKGIGAAERGTALHQFMQHLPLTAGWTIQGLETLLARLIDKKMLTVEEGGSINLHQVLDFTKTPLYEKISRADTIKKELPFMTLVKVGEDDRSEILLQGVIDLLAEFEDEIYIVDYKTDYVHDFKRQEAELAQRYAVQMKYYQKAVSEIFPLKSITSHVYFLNARKEIVFGDKEAAK